MLLGCPKATMTIHDEKCSWQAAVGKIKIEKDEINGQ